MRKQLHSLKAFVLTLALSFVTMGMLAADLKPYPVYFSLGDYPEFRELNGWRNPTSDNTWPGFADISSFFWTSDDTDWTNNGTGNKATTDGKYNCTTIGYHVYAGTLDHNGTTKDVRNAYGDYLDIACGYNRMRAITFTLPWLNPGTYRVYAGMLFLQTGSNSYRWGSLTGSLFDGDTLSLKVDSTLTQLKLGPKGEGAFGSFNAPHKNYIMSNSANYGTTGFYFGEVVVETAGIHKYTILINTNAQSGLNLGFDMLQFIPVTAADADEDYAYPKFDVGGNIYLDASYQYANYTGGNNVYKVGDYDSTGLSSIICDLAGKSMNVLPFQVSDPTEYTTFKITLNAGGYFAGKTIAVLRSEDNWTRMFTGTVGQDGSIVADLPAGTYYCELENINYMNTTFDVSADASVFVGTETAVLNVKYNADDWYIGQSFRVYTADGVTMVYDKVINADGTVDAMELPMGNYYYVIAETEDKSGYFEKEDVSVTSSQAINVDKTTAKYAVSISAGTDNWAVSKDFRIYRKGNINALYVDDAVNASGTCNLNLPAGNYVFVLDNGFVYNEFTVIDAALTLDLSKRYTVNMNLGNIMNGYSVDVSKDDTLLVGTITIVNGTAALSGLSDGKYSHNVYKGGDTVAVLMGFEIEAADANVGDANDLNQPYILPRAVFFDPLQQPEIQYAVDGQKFYPGDLKFIDLPTNVSSYKYELIDSVYIDSTSTWKYNYDSTKVADSTLLCPLEYEWIGSGSNNNNSYVNGDYAIMNLRAGNKLTFTTPIINKGRYNVYISSRYNGSTNKPTIDTTYVDGVATGQNEVMFGHLDAGTWAVNSTTIRRYGTSYGSGNIMAAWFGQTELTYTGRHELTLYTIKGGTHAIWVDLIMFVPVSEDAVPDGVFYPRFDVCGNAVYEGGTATYDIGTDQSNHIFAPYQMPDKSVYKNENANLAAALTLNAGIYSAADQLSLRSTKDNWTHYEYVADSTTGNITAYPAVPDVYNWQMLNEGIVGTSLFNLTSANTLTIPETLPSKLTGTYEFIPNEDDLELGTVEMTAKVSLDGNYPFTYPITGAVLFYDYRSEVSVDTLYRGSKGMTTYQMPDYAKEDLAAPGEVQFEVLYKGNGKRLQGSDDFAAMVGMKETTLTGVTVYPNPATEFVQINLKGHEGARYALYNQLGQLVGEGNIKGSSATVGLSGTVAGMYFLQVKSEGVQEIFKLLVR